MKSPSAREGVTAPNQAPRRIWTAEKRRVRINVTLKLKKRVEEELPNGDGSASFEEKGWEGGRGGFEFGDGGFD